MEKFPEQIRGGLNAGLQLLKMEGANHHVVAVNSPFSRLFGRENIYISMTADK
jgi:ABC-type uncharacterized transport system YnjBCD ATPase subunit